MKKSFLFSIIILFSLVLNSQDILWSEVHTGGGDNLGKYVVSDDYNNVYVGVNGYYSSVSIVKYDSEGNQLMTFINDTASFINDMVIGNDGKIYWIGGIEGSGGDIDGVIYSINPDGSIHYYQAFDYDGENDIFTDLEVDDDGNAFVIGDSFMSTNGIRVVIKYLPDGTPNWIQLISLNMPGHWLQGGRICFSESGNVLVSGIFRDFFSQHKSISLAEFSQNGIQQNTWKSNLGDQEGVSISTMHNDGNGNTFIAGTMGSLLNTAGFLLCFDKDSAIFNKTIESNNGLVGIRCGTLDDDGNIILAGFSNENEGSGYVTKFSKTGGLLFEYHYDGLGNGDEYFEDVVYSNSYIYLTGRCQGIGTGRDMLTLCLDDAGDFIWDATNNGFDNGDDNGNALAVDEDENVIISGYTETMGGSYCTTVKYSNPLSIMEPFSQEDRLILYPNPSRDVINLSVDAAQSQLNYKIINLQGQIIQSGQILKSSINIQDLDNGVYFLKVDEENTSTTVRFVKQ